MIILVVVVIVLLPAYSWQHFYTVTVFQIIASRQYNWQKYRHLNLKKCTIASQKYRHWGKYRHRYYTVTTRWSPKKCRHLINTVAWPKSTVTAVDFRYPPQKVPSRHIKYRHEIVEKVPSRNSVTKMKNAVNPRFPWWWGKRQYFSRKSTVTEKYCHAPKVASRPDSHGPKK